MRTDRGGRPRSELRLAVMEAARLVIADSGPATWRDIAARVPGINPAAPAELRLVRHTVNNLHRAGELTKAGTRAVPGSRRPHRLYLLGDPLAPRCKSDQAHHESGRLANFLKVWDEAMR